MILFAFFFILIWVSLAVRYYNRTHNPYVESHKKKLMNDKRYRDYLKWCDHSGEAPADKKVVLKSVDDKEKQIKNLFR